MQMKSWIEMILRWRKTVVVLTTLVTAFFLFQLKTLSVIIDPDDILPQTHPYVRVNNEIEKIFGNKFTIVIGITNPNGSILTPEHLAVLKRLTDNLLQLPGVIKTNVSGLAARKSKSIMGTEEGMIVRPLMEVVPTTQSDLDALHAGVNSNPVYKRLLISEDQKTTQIVAEFKKVPGGFKAIADSVETIVAPERASGLELSVGGLPIFLALLEKYSERMGFLFPLAVLLIGLIHYEAFRTVQALVLPLVTALIAVVWAVGVLALIGQPMDVFNASTPILILAIAAGHAVQILKRYYEEFALGRDKNPSLSPRFLSEQAVVTSLSKVGPVMIVACLVAALGFFSLIIFEIKSIRTFGVFTGAGVIAALILELTFIPAVRSLIRPPNEREYLREKERSIWDKITEFFFKLVTKKRKQVYIISAAAVAILALGGYWLRIDNSQKSYFYGQIPARLDDDRLNERMAGTNTIYVYVDGQTEDAIKDPKVLKAIEDTQLFLGKEANVGKTVSIVDFLKRMNKAMNADDPKFDRIPETQDLVGQYLLLYSNSGEPGDFDSYVDYGYQRALIQTFVKTDSSAYVEDLAQRLKAFTAKTFPAGVEVRVGGGTAGGVALNEVMIREKTLNILQLMGAVFLISSLVFRSFLAGALILVPLIAAVVVNFGIMGLIGIPLQIATALVSAMAVGIGADYGIYMSYRLREELSAGGEQDAAIQKAFRSAGKATLFVSSAVAGGFGVLMLSWGFMIHMWMGFLIATAMLVSSITALTVFPSLILTLRPKFIFNPSKGAFSMKTVSNVTSAFLALLFVAFAPNTSVSAADLTAEQIMTKNFETSKVVDSTSDSTFKLINASGQQRVRETKGHTKLIPGTLDNRRLVTFLSPSDVKGTKTLLIEHAGKDDDIWIYLPAMKKVRRLVASNKRDSFVGTDFSYGDVIGHRVEDWNHKIIGEGKIQDRNCWRIESTPKTPKVTENSGYSKRSGCVDKESFIGLDGEIYDAGGQLLKKVTSTQIEKVDAKTNKWQPMRLEAENVQTGHKTVIEFKNFKANVGVSDDLFTQRTLEKQ